MDPRAKRIRRVVLTGTAVALCAAAVVAIAIVVSGDPGHTGTQWAGTAVALLLFGAAAAAGTSVLNGSRPAVVLGWLCIGVALAGFLVAAVMMWSTAEDDDAPVALVKAAGTLFVSAFALADLSLLARRSAGDGRRSRAVVSFTQCAALVLAGLLVIAILAEISDEAYFRWVGAAAILWLLGTALVPLSRRLAEAS